MSLPDRSHPVDIQFDVSSALQLALLLLALGLGLWLGHRHSHPTLVLRRRSLVACQIVFMSGFQIMSAAVLLLAQVLPMAGVIYAQFALGLGICFGSGFMGLYLGPSRSLDAFGTSRYGYFNVVPGLNLFMLLKGPETPRAEDGKELLPFLGRGNRGVLTAIAVYLATIALVSLVPVSTGPAVDVIVN